jgi:hypothetical protein
MRAALVKLFFRVGVRALMSLLRDLPLYLAFAGFACASLAHGGDSKDVKAMAELDRYPLRLHILAVDDVHRTVRMQPNWCGASIPDGSGADPGACSSGSASLGGGENDFSGAGRADLVTPPQETIGLNFRYEGCSRIRVAPGFTGLPARWRKPGETLEVLIPNDALGDDSLKTQHCRVQVTPQTFVYLRLHNGSIIRVAQQAYASKPGLRRLLSGGNSKLERRRATGAGQP